MENLIRQGLMKSPIFTVTMKDANTNATGQGGHFTFGYLDQSSYKGQIGYAPVNTSQGFWQVNSPYFKIGRSGDAIPRSASAITTSSAKQSAGSTKAQTTSVSDLSTASQGLSVSDAADIASQVLAMGNLTQSRATAAGGLQNLAMPEHSVIIDTGTTLMLIDDMTLLTIYNQVAGATYNSSLGGYTVPCATTSPDTFYMIGDSFYGVPGSSLPFASVGNGQCFGGIQSRGSFPMDI